MVPISNYAGILFEVVREHDSGCPGARFRLSGSTGQVVREHDLALPARLSGSTGQDVLEHVSMFFVENLSYRFLTLQVSKRGFSLDSEDRLSGACSHTFLHTSIEKVKIFNCF